jgi:RHS repeat-associated protein
MVSRGRRVPVALLTLVSFVSAGIPRSAFAADAPSGVSRPEGEAAAEARSAVSQPAAAPSKAADAPGAGGSDTSSGGAASSSVEHLKENGANPRDAANAPKEQPAAAVQTAGGSPSTLALPAGSGDKSGVTSQSISVPQGAGKIQGMGESFSTQLSTGVATYTIPFALPGARGHAQPSLALSYSSSMGHGNAGVGWDIGVPFIARQTDRGIPRYADPAAGGAFRADQDRFVFNGGQELVPLCVVDAGLQCPAALPSEAMPTWSAGYMYFRARVEGSFMRFFWSPDHLTWRVQDKSGVSMELGVPGDEPSYRGALETDASGARVFRWNLARQYDANGGDAPVNVVQYRYLSDGGLGYLSDIYDTPAAAPPPYALGSYAHHTHLSYEGRTDPMTSFKRGFRTSSALRLRGVDVSSFALTPGSKREMVRRYYLTYDQAWHASLLSSVQMEGRCTAPTLEDDSQLIAPTNCPRLPAISLGYQHVQGFDAGGAAHASELPGYEAFDERVHTMAGSPDHSINENLTDLFDINSDALPDVLVTAPGFYNGSHGVFFNRATGFDAVTRMAVNGVLGANAGDISLDNSNVVSTDVDGDSIVNLLHMPMVKEYSVYTPALAAGAWSWQGRVISTAGQQSPKVNFQQQRPSTRVMDVNGDGLVDIVYSSGTDIQTFFSLGRYPTADGQFGQAIWTGPASAAITNDPVTACLPWAGAPVRLGDPDVRMGDMNGDGLPDIVRVRNGNVLYFPGRGNGLFGTGELDDCPSGSFGAGREVRMANGPNWLDPDVSKIRIDDVNGDGLDDFVMIRFNAVDVWLNVDGVGWTATRHTLAGAPISSITNRARLVDMNGSGTRDILWGDGLNYRYVDLSGGERPWVLTSVSNGLGKTTDIGYSTSTALMLAAASAGTPWSSTMPMVAHVVTSMTEHDNLGVVGQPAGTYVTQYVYENPVYDGRQREFRGFRTTRVTRVGDANSPSSTTQSTFLLGECKDEAPDDGVDSCSLPERWRDNPREALKGLPTISETYDTNNVYAGTQHHTYRLRQLYMGLDGRAVRHAFDSASDSFAYDTGPFHPGASTRAMPAVELEGADGTPFTDVTEDVPMRSASVVRVMGTSYVDLFGNATQHWNYGCVEGCTQSDPVIVSGVDPLNFGGPSQWLWRPFEPYVIDLSDGVYRQFHILYHDTSGNLVLDVPVLDRTVPLHRFHETGAAVAPTPADAAVGTPSSMTYDTYGNMTQFTGPNGRCRSVTYDDAYASLATSETILAGAVSGSCGTIPLTASAIYDRGLGAPTQVTDVHAATTRVAYDGFGRLTSLYRPDPATGAASSVASMTAEYLLTSDAATQPYSMLHTRTQDGADPSVASYQDAWAMVDGMGRTLVSFAQADPGAGDLGEWVASGLTQYDAKGAVTRAYLPWFYTGTPAEFALAGATPATRYQHQRYDAFGRLLETYGLDGVITLKNVYHAISQDAWDAADLLPGPHSNTPVSVTKDGHGRTIAVTERVHAGGGLEERTTTTSYIATGKPSRITRTRGGDVVTRWMQYDTFDHLVLNAEPHTTKNFNPDPAADLSTMEAWRYVYNDAGDLIGTSDARGCGENYAYDAAGRLVGEDYSPCLAAHVAYSAPDPATGEGYEVLNRYDTVDPDMAGALPASGASVLGRLTSSTDRGSKAVSRYDGRGRVTGIARRVAKPDSDGAAVADRFAARWYVKEAVFDAADRPVRETTGVQSPELQGAGGASEVVTTYTKRGAVAQVGSSYGALVSHVIHDADGLPAQIQYGDLAQTTTDFGHDEKRRLSTVQTYRGPPGAWTNAPEGYSPAPEYGAATPTSFQLILEDGEFAYDVVDNPTAIRDWRNPAEWPAGAKPVSRSIQYDDLSRVTRVDYQYAAGDDTWTDPFAAEDTGASTDPRRAKPSPHVSFEKRSLSQSFAYDWLGNTVATGDDASGFYDRSLGDITNAAASGKPYQLSAASNEAGGSPRAGHLTTTYDDAGNLRSMAVVRGGPCVPAGSVCGQRYAYDWDEVGQLTKARRWDVADPGSATDALPEDVPAVELRYAYDGGGQRVLKTAVDPAGAQVHTVYALGSVELRRAPFQDGDYVDDHTTEVGYLSAHGVKLARLHYAEGDLPSLSSGHLHVLLEMPDHLGSSSIVIDRETSELVERSTYLAPGTADSDYRTERWDSFREDYRFTGKEEDSEVGLAYFGARYLAPSLGRWISADPLAVHGLGADMNVYAYVSGKLLSATDPLGLDEKKAGPTVASTLEGAATASPGSPFSIPIAVGKYVGRLVGSGDAAGQVRSDVRAAAAGVTILTSPLTVVAKPDIAMKLSEAETEVALDVVVEGASEGLSMIPEGGAAGKEAAAALKTEAGAAAKREAAAVLKEAAPELKAAVKRIRDAAPEALASARRNSANASILRENLRLAGRPVKEGEAAGHIVPSGGTLGRWAPAVRAREILARNNIGLNDADNGIPIGHPNPHGTMHTKEFIAAVDSRLVALETKMLEQGHNARAIELALRQELRAIGEGVRR